MDDREERRQRISRRHCDLELYGWMDQRLERFEARLERIEANLLESTNRAAARLSVVEERLIARAREDAEIFRDLLKAENESRSSWRRWRANQVQRGLSGLLWLVGGMLCSLLALGLYEWVQRHFPAVLSGKNGGRWDGMAGVIAIRPWDVLKRFLVRHWRRAGHAGWLLITGAVCGLVLTWYGGNLLSPPLIVDGPPIPQTISVCRGEQFTIRYLVHKVKPVDGLVGRHLNCLRSGRHDMPVFPTFLRVGDVDVLHQVRLPEEVPAGDSCRYSVYIDYQNDLVYGWIRNPITLRIEMDEVQIDVKACDPGEH